MGGNIYFICKKLITKKLKKCNTCVIGVFLPCGDKKSDIYTSKLAKQITLKGYFIINKNGSEWGK